MLEYEYNRDWKVLIFVSQKDLNEETKLRYLKYMGGQGVYFCQEHDIPLSTDYVKSNRKCSISLFNNSTQILLVNLHGDVLKKDCIASVCEKHFLQFSSTNDRVLVNNAVSDEPVEESSDEDIELLPESEVQTDINLPTPSFILDN